MLNHNFSIPFFLGCAIAPNKFVEPLDQQTVNKNEVKS